MRIKTFYAKSVAEALQKVKKEFGDDALILSSKEKPLRIALGLRSRTTVEVVAATDAEAAHDWYERRAARNSADGEPEQGCRGDAVGYPAPHGDGPLSCGERAPAEAEYNEMRRVLCSRGRPFAMSSGEFPNPACYELYLDLVANEVSDWLAYKMLDEARRNTPSAESRDKSELLRSVVNVALRLLPEPAPADDLPGKQAVFLVGPTGVGKTTAVAKLGARLALESKKNVLLMTTDTCRIGAIDQLRTYAGLMGLPFRVVGRISDLPQLLSENSQRDYILIDTAGHAQRDLSSSEELTRYLGAASDIERHLVISATTKSCDMHEIVDRFSVCHPDRLLVTKLDETSTFGPIFNELVRTQKPLSYFTDGQRVPEDLHVAGRDQIVEILLNAH
jgi:flagellar biosynthesis protein FlhF